MSSETVGLILAAVTLLVIGASAVAAIVQLRHLRASNQLSALLEIMNQWNQPALQAAYGEFAGTMSRRISDPEYVTLLESPSFIDREKHPEFLIFDLWEQVGTYASMG